MRDIATCHVCIGSGVRREIDCDFCGGSGLRRKCHRNECYEHGCSGYGDCYVPPKPPRKTLNERLRLAWGVVFTGRYDALDWRE